MSPLLRCDCCGRDSATVVLVRSPSCGETYACAECRGDDSGGEAMPLTTSEYDRLADQAHDDAQERACELADRGEP